MRARFLPLALSAILALPAARAADRPPRAPGRSASTIRVDTTLVLVPVVVTDRLNRPVIDLRKENFRVFEDKAEQELLYFGSEDQAISAGIVFDTSRSMQTVMRQARTAVSLFVDTANPEDEAFLVTFRTFPELTAGFTSQLGRIAASLVFSNSGGCTALIDAIWLALDQMPNARHPRKALVIVSDGFENHSRRTGRELLSRVRESDVLIYTVRVRDRNWGENFQPDNVWRATLLEDLAEATGGRCFIVESAAELSAAAGKIGRLLRNQYVLGYRPRALAADGRYHRIDVKLNRPPSAPKLNASWRRGYYASVE